VTSELNNRDDIISQYLAEAVECEEAAALVGGEEQQSWLELAARLRKMALAIQGS